MIGKKRQREEAGEEAYEDIETTLYSKLLIDVVQREESRSIKEWNDLLEIFDNFLVDFNLRQQGKKKRQRQQSLSQAVILAGAIITVASHRVERFGELFHQLRSWNNIGGCWWVCLEELLRHFLLLKLQSTLTGSTEAPVVIVSQLRQKVREIFIKTVPKGGSEESGCDADQLAILEGVDMPILSRRLQKMQTKLLVMIDAIELNWESHQEIFSNFLGETPLESFVGWFVSWATLKIVSLQSTKQSVDISKGDCFLNCNAVITAYQILSKDVACDESNRQEGDQGIIKALLQSVWDVFSVQ